MRITVVSLPAYGHLYPMIPLALGCRDAGHDVTLSVGEQFGGSLPLPVAAVGSWDMTLQWAEGETARRHPELSGREAAMAMFADVVASAVAGLLVDAWEPERPDLVLYESACTGAGAGRGRCGTAGAGRGARPLNPHRAPMITAFGG